MAVQALRNLSKTGVKILHPSYIGRLINLGRLKLEGSRLENIPDELCCLKSLTRLSISNCIAINKEKLRVLFDGLRSLEKLYLKNCYNLSELPDNISLLSMLWLLSLDGSSVERLPASIKHLQQLYMLSLKDCRKLQCVPELPPSIGELYADNCTSLVMVSLSTAKISNAKMYGFVFSFKNCVKLVGHSFKGIMEEATIAAFLNFDRRVSVRVCMPGSRVPRQFKYRTTQSFINIELPSVPNLSGFFLSVVLSSPSPTIEFSVTGRHGGLIVMKECGVRLIYVSEIYSLLSELEWNLDDMVELGVKLGLKLDLHHMRWFHEMHVKDIVLKLLQLNWDVSMKYEYESGYKTILAAIKKKSKKSNEVVPESRSVLGELEMEFDKKVELGLKLGLALGMNQLESEMKDCQSFESARLALFRAIVNEAQKSNELVLKSPSFLGKLELEIDKKVVMGVTLGLRLGWEQRMSKGIMLYKLWNILKDGLEWEESLKLEFESRRREVLTTIEKETQKSNEFVFPPLPTRIWKNRTQGLKDIVSLFP